MRRVLRVAAYTAAAIALLAGAALDYGMLYFAVHPGELIDVLGG